MIFNNVYGCLVRLDRWWDKKLRWQEMRKLASMSNEELEKIAGVAGIADEDEKRKALKRMAGGGP